jgi:hypothetical protein
MCNRLIAHASSSFAAPDIHVPFVISFGSIHKL